MSTCREKGCQKPCAKKIRGLGLHSLCEEHRAKQIAATAKYREEKKTEITVCRDRANGDIRRTKAKLLKGVSLQETQFKRNFGGVQNLKAAFGELRKQADLLKALKAAPPSEEASIYEEQVEKKLKEERRKCLKSAPPAPLFVETWPQVHESLEQRTEQDSLKEAFESWKNPLRDGLIVQNVMKTAQDVDKAKYVQRVYRHSRGYYQTPRVKLLEQAKS